jgi:hypothetical protein
MTNQDHNAWLLLREPEQQDLMERVKARRLLQLPENSTTLRFDAKQILKCWTTIRNAPFPWSDDYSTSQRLAFVESALRFAWELFDIELEVYLESDLYE